MFKARYYKADGKKGKARALPEAIFDGVVNEGVIHQAVKAYLNNQRQGTGSAKNRSAVRGGSRKPWRQKGTGRARQGTIRAPQWEGGGVVFGPTPKSWRTSLPKKVRTLARRSALNDRAENDRVVVADLPAMDAPKTRELVGFLAGMELEGKTLVLTAGHNRNVYLSARNLQRVQVMPFGDESAYDVLWANNVLIEREALEAAEAEAPAAPAETTEAEAAEAEETAAEATEAEESAAEATEAEEAAAEPEEVEAAAAEEGDADEGEEKTDA